MQAKPDRNRQLHALHPSAFHQTAKGYLLPDFYSGATGQPGRFSEGFSLRRLHLLPTPGKGLARPARSLREGETR